MARYDITRHAPDNSILERLEATSRNQAAGLFGLVCGRLEPGQRAISYDAVKAHVLNEKYIPTADEKKDRARARLERRAQMMDQDLRLSASNLADAMVRLANHLLSRAESVRGYIEKFDEKGKLPLYIVNGLGEVQGSGADIDVRCAAICEKLEARDKFEDLILQFREAFGEVADV